MSAQQPVVYAALILATCMAATPAFAQEATGTAESAAEPKTYTDEELDRATAEFELGGKAYYEGDYTKAILHLRAAYRIVPEAAFLYNIALAEFKLGRFDQALATGERAAEGKLADPDRTSNLARIAALRARVSSIEVATGVSNHAFLPPPKDVRISSWTWIGATTGGLGLFLLATTMGIGIANSDQVDAYEAAGARGDDAEFNRLREQIDSSQTIGQTMFWIGLPLFLGGTGVVVWDQFLSGDSEVEASIDVRNEQFTVGLSAEF